MQQFSINKIFSPATGVDMVFDMDGLESYSRPSIIYDIDLDASLVTIAQPLVQFTKNTKVKNLYLTTILQDKNRKMRVGVKCRQFKLIDLYPLANKKTVPAVLIKYELPVHETNIRSAFRLPLSTRYIIRARLVYHNLDCHTSKDFSIRDISLTGIGIVGPPKQNNGSAPLSGIKINDTLQIELTLINLDQKTPVATIPIKAKAVRINTVFLETQTMVGLKILNLDRRNETLLSKFIHEAQIDELKRLSGLNL